MYLSMILITLFLTRFNIKSIKSKYSLPLLYFFINMFVILPIISLFLIIHIFTELYRKVPSQMTVVVGTNYLSQPGIVHTVNKLIWHEFYNECLVRNDIGLILVNGYIKYNDKIQPIPLARVYYVPQETNAVVTGWRKLNVSDFIN